MVLDALHEVLRRTRVTKLRAPGKILTRHVPGVSSGHQALEWTEELPPAFLEPLACPSSSAGWAVACAGEGLACRWRLMKGKTLGQKMRTSSRSHSGERTRDGASGSR